MSEWKEYKLVELATKITKGTTPSTLGDGFKSKGVNFIKAESVLKEGYIDISKFSFIDIDTHNKLKRSQLENKDILFSMAGVILGKTALIEEKHLPANINQAVALIRLNKTLAKPEFVKYYLGQKRIFDYVNSSSGQSAQPNINLAEIGDLKIQLPDLTTQTAIAEILTSLDDKIELNNQINKDLEALAQALFKQWFIDFDFPNENGEPYRSSGGEMMDSELGEIPKSWIATNYGAITKKENLKVKKSKKSITKVYSAIKTSELVLSEDYFTKQVFSKSLVNYYVVENFWFAYNPSRINIGSIGLNKNEAGAVSPVYVVFSAVDNMHFYIENHLKLENIKNEIIQKCSGTVRQALNYDSLSTFPVVKPPKSLIDKFNLFWAENSNSISQINSETEYLIGLRDELLPKLISGELEVSDTLT